MTENSSSASASAAGALSLPSAAMPLIEFARLHYLAAPHHNSGKLSTPQLVYKVVQLCNQLDEAIGRPAAVADLTKGNLAKLTVKMAERPPKVVRFFDSLFRALVRYAGSVGLVETPDELLPQVWPNIIATTGAADELWTVCEQQYFRLKRAVRSPNTKRAYRYAIDSFSGYLGRPATLSDLNDDTFATWLGWLLDRDKSVYTTREKLGRVLALWRFLAARRDVDAWPTIERPEAPDVMPIALNPEQLRALFAACATMGGHIAGIPACRWWRSLLAFVWNTSERRGATLAIRCEWIDWHLGVVQIPAKARKGRRKTACYKLWPQTLSLMEAMRLPERELFWPWERCEATYWYQYGKLLKMAGIPNDRKHKTHCLRVSHNTWHKAMTDKHSPLLQHGSSETSEKSYEDKRYTQPEPPKLFIPWEPEQSVAEDPLLAWL